MLTAQPTISVIIPAYNAEGTILKTIQSVQKQTFSDFELIVIDDGSNDGTLEQLSTIPDPRLKVFSYPNGGVAIARNRGIAHAKGEFISFLDADDLWAIDKLELQLQALRQQPEAGVAYSWTHFIEEDGNFFFKGEQTSFDGHVYDKLLFGNFLKSGSNPLIRRQAIESIEGFDPTLPPAEDWDFYLRLATHWPFVVVPKPQIFYRQVSKSASSQVKAMEEGSLRVLQKAFQNSTQDLQKLNPKILAHLYQFLAHLYLKRSLNREGVQQATHKLKVAISLHPWILLASKTQILVAKLLLIYLLPNQVSRYILQVLSNIHRISTHWLDENKASYP
ncbi:MAG: glycosyltransferase [Leptolyngbyaceae bacterium]|nr:glycosyltransferase [Leptolyngbyaceae bacterium]